MTCIDIVQRTAADLPQSASQTLFTISGPGSVLLLGLFGVVTTALSYSNIGISVSIGDIIVSGSGNFTSQPIGALLAKISGFTTTGVVPPAIVNNSGYQSLVAMPNSTITFTTSENISGQMRWMLWYMPLDPGAYVSVS